jgi:CRP-like cAMP-binding protein
MWSKDIPTATDIITEGEAADNFFVVEQGEFEVDKNGVVVATIGPWELIGELAIMYALYQLQPSFTFHHSPHLWAGTNTSGARP